MSEPVKIKSCYRSGPVGYETSKCSEHSWSAGRGVCARTGKGVKPSICGHSFIVTSKRLTKLRNK